MSSKQKQSVSDISVNVSGHNMKIRTEVVSIEALSWAAERAGLSYGRFTLSLSTQEQQNIQMEYENWKKDCQRERTKRTVEYPDYPSSPYSAGILMDEDI